MEYTTIKITKETRELLKSLGKKGDSYDEIIYSLMKDVTKLNQRGDDGTGGSSECS